MAEFAVSNANIKRNYYDISKNTPNKAVRIVLAVLAAAACAGAVFMWVANAHNLFKFASYSASGQFFFLGNAGFWERILAAVATADVFIVGFVAARYAFDNRFVEGLSYPDSIKEHELEEIRSDATKTLADVRNLLCRPRKKEDDKPVYHRTVNLGPHVDNKRLTIKQKEELEQVIENYNQVLQQLENLEKETFTTPRPSEPQYLPTSSLAPLTAFSSDGARLEHEQNETNKKTNAQFKTNYDQSYTQWLTQQAEWSSQKRERKQVLESRKTEMEKDWNQTRANLFHNGELDVR